MIADSQDSLTAGPRGPLLMQDYQSLENLANWNRRRVAERSVHAERSAAHRPLKIMQLPRPGAVKSNRLAVSS